MGRRNVDVCNLPVGLPLLKNQTTPRKEPPLCGGFLCGKPAGKLLVDVVAHFVEQHVLAYMVNMY